MKTLKTTFLSLLFVTTLVINLFASGDEQSGGIIHLTKAQFNEKIMNMDKTQDAWKYLGTVPCVVDFYADWCPPCRKASPILAELAQKYKGKIIVYKVNTDQEKDLASIFNISGIPAFLWVPMKGKPTMSSGIANSDIETKAMFEKMINNVLLK